MADNVETMRSGAANGKGPLGSQQQQQQQQQQQHAAANAADEVPSNKSVKRSSERTSMDALRKTENEKKQKRFLFCSTGAGASYITIGGCLLECGLIHYLID